MRLLIVRFYQLHHMPKNGNPHLEQMHEWFISDSSVGRFNASVALEVARVLVVVRRGSSSTNSSTSAAKSAVLVRLAKASRLLVAGTARAAGDRTAALLVAKTVTMLASSSSTSGKALSVTVNALTLTTTVGLVLTVVIAVAMKMHAPVALELFLLELLSVGLRAALKLGTLLGSLLGKTTALVGELL